MAVIRSFVRALLAIAPIALTGAVSAQTCTTQSQLQPDVRNGLAEAAMTLAKAIESSDSAAVKAQTIPEFASSFSGVAGVIADTAPHLKGGTPVVDQLYILDATKLTAAADAQFFCTLNQSAAEADFSIPQLPPGRYGFAIVNVDDTTPWRLSFLLRQDNNRWLLAGLYPKPLSAGGHDGLWYWTEARRELAAKDQKDQWNAWLDLQEAQALLQPAGFVSSTHLDKLFAEESAAAPPAAKSISAEAPLVLTARDGAEFRFTSIGVDDSLGTPRIDVAAHLKVPALGDPAAARARNLAAMAALVDAHPELRTAFHGVWIFADAPGASPYATESPMAEIP